MKAHPIIVRSTLLLSVVLPVMVTVAARADEQIKLDDGTTCTILEGATTAGGGTSTSITAGNGAVSSSTTINGRNTTSGSGGLASSSAGSSVTSGNTGGQAFSTATATRPDGSIITRRSDGSCDITKPNK